MSMYGPPGGQYPGQPSDPWQQNEPYGQPSGAPYPTSPYGPPDPWSAPPASPGTPGNQPGYGQQPGYDQGYQQDPYAPSYGQQAPGYGQQAPGYGQQSAPPYGQQPDPFGQQPVWGAPTPPQKKKSVGGIVALIVVLVVVLCGGGITGLYFIGKNSNKPVAQNTPTPGVNGTDDATDDASPTPEDSPTPDVSDDDITTVRVGQCVVNTGTDSDAHLVIKPCTKGTFKVLKRYDGVADKKKCDAIRESDYWYTYTTTPSTEDFTLCLKEQK